MKEETNQVELLQESFDLYEEALQDLNKLEQELLSILSPETQILFKKTQESWIQFLSAETKFSMEFYTQDIFEKKIQPILWGTFKTSLVNIRIEQLLMFLGKKQ